MCDCEDVKRLIMLLNMERLKTKIYRQLIEQKINVTLDDRTDDLINEVVTRRYSPPSRKTVGSPVQTRRLSPVAMRRVSPARRVSPEHRVSPKKLGKSAAPVKKFRTFPKCIEEVEHPGDEDMKEIDMEIKDMVVEKFGAFDLSVSKLEIKKAFEALKESKTYTNILVGIKQHRTFFMTIMSLYEYTTLITEHILHFKNIFIERLFPEKKINALLSKFLTPLDFRLTCSDGFEKQHIDVEEIDKLKMCLKLSMNYPKAYRCFEHSHFYNFFINYSLAFLDISSILEIYVSNPYGYKNIIYVQSDETDDSLGFSFYVLDRVDGPKRYWKMDCRLEHLVDELILGIRQFVITNFRKIYKICVGHNEYVEDYKTKSEILEFDCEQLLKNLFLSTNNLRFNEKVRTAVRNTSTHVATNNDKFDFIQDDKEQLANFRQYRMEDDEIVKLIQELFDNIDSGKALEFYQNKV